MPLFCQVPLLSQAWGCNPLHCLAPEVHAAHVPALQTFGQAVPLFCQVPVASQVWG